MGNSAQGRAAKSGTCATRRGGKVAFAGHLPQLLLERIPHLETRSMTSEESSSKIPSTEEEWKEKLTPEQFKVLRLKHTERPGTGKYNKTKKTGVYKCVGCDAALYTSTQKFDSGCGWPAFYDNVKGAVTEVPDADGRRVEIICSSCNSHLGHIFRGEGFNTPTDARHCVNSVCLELDESGDVSKI